MMVDSFFQQLDGVRIDRTRGRQTRTIGRVTFAMMFFMTRSTDPALRQQLLAAEAYCNMIVPRSAYRWLEAGWDNGRLIDMRDGLAVKAGLDAMQDHASDLAFYTGQYEFDAKSGEVPGHAIQIATDVSNDRVDAQSSFQLNIPLPWFEAQGTPELPQKIFADLTGILRPLHAQGGLCMATARDPIWMQDGAEDLYPILHACPGLMNGWAANVAQWMGTAMQPVNWLNAVHDDLIAICGGREAVLAHLDVPGFVTTAFADGLVIQAGPTPQVGNREADEKIVHYGKLARALMPARVAVPTDRRTIASDYRMPGSWDAGLDEPIIAANREYLTRFDDM
jgi:Protein of unknown function (DUF3396)